MASLLVSSMRGSLSGRLVANPNLSVRNLNTAARSYPRTRFPSTRSNYTRGPVKQRTSYSTVVVQDRKKGRTGRILTSILIGVASFTVGGYFALTYAPPFLTSLVMGSIPTDEDSLKFTAPDQWTKEIDEHIKMSALAESLRKDPSYRESRPHQKMPKEIAQHNLLAGTLSTPDTIPVPPTFFNKKDGSAMIAIYYIGSHVSGHPGIVHGGFLAALLDEGLALCAFAAMPNKMGVTAQLNITYKKPTMASQYLVLVATTDKVEGRKGFSSGRILPLDAYQEEDGSWDLKQTLVEANALFVEPKHAKLTADHAAGTQEPLSASHIDFSFYQRLVADE